MMKRIYPSWSDNSNSYISRTITGVVLAVFQLRDDLIVESGEGTYANPYALKVDK